jgi:molybdate transport system substrate-binding protein
MTTTNRQTERPGVLFGNVAACFALILLPGPIAGCRDDATSGADRSTRLVLYCGAGIRPPVEELIEQFTKETGITIEADYAGSEVLLTRLKLGRQGDLYMPGDRHYVQLAEDEGLILADEPVCYFVPTILVQKGNPHGIRGLHDLLKPGVRLGLGDARACAIGRTSKRIFEKNGIAWEDVEKNLAYQSMTVNELGLQIQARSVDAVIVWDAIAEYYADDGETIPIPPAQNISSTVNCGILSFTTHREQAERFIELARSPQGQAIFAKHGYRVEPPATQAGQ